MLSQKEVMERLMGSSAILLGSDLETISRYGFKVLVKRNMRKRFEQLFDRLLPAVDEGFLLEYGSLSDFVSYFGVDQDFSTSEVVEGSKARQVAFMARFFIPHGFTHGDHRRAKTVILLVSDRDTIFELVRHCRDATFATRLVRDLGDVLLFKKGEGYFSRCLEDFFLTDRTLLFRWYKHKKGAL